MKKIFIFLFFLLTSNLVLATSDLEKKELNRIVGEISVIEQMVKSARKNQVPGDPERFRYEALIRDLELVRQGISDHLNSTYDSTYEREPLFGENKGSY